MDIQRGRELTIVLLFHFLFLRFCLFFGRVPWWEVGRGEERTRLRLWEAGPHWAGKICLRFAGGPLGPRLPLALNFELADGQGLLFFFWPRPFFLFAGKGPLLSPTFIMTE